MVTFIIISIFSIAYGCYLNLKLQKSLSILKSRYLSESIKWPFKSDRELFLLLAFYPKNLEKNEAEFCDTDEFRRILVIRRSWLIFIISLIPLFVIGAILETIIKEIL